jgi:hypothetical protein
MVIEPIENADTQIRGAVETDSEIASLDSFPVVVIYSLSSLCEQVYDFAIKCIVEVRRDVLICELFFDRRLNDEIDHTPLLPPVRTYSPSKYGERKHAGLVDCVLNLPDPDGDKSHKR